MDIKDYLKTPQYLSEAGYINAAWVAPKGQVLDIGRASHINFVIDHPKKFGLTDDDVKNCGRCGAEGTGKKGITTYTDGIEDKDWTRITSKVLKNGFIRIRRVRISNYSYLWYVDIHEFNSRTRKVLSDMAYSMKKNQDDRVIISVAKGDAPNGIATISDLTRLVEEHELLQLTLITEMTNIHEV